MSTFASMFRELVTPALERECYVQGVLISCGLEDFGGAERRIRAVAHARGAAFLPEHLHDSLTDWILTRLLRHIEGAEARAAPGRAIADKVAADITAWEAACQTTRTP